MQLVITGIFSNQTDHVAGSAHLGGNAEEDNFPAFVHERFQKGSGIVDGDGSRLGSSLVGIRPFVYFFRCGFNAVKVAVFSHHDTKGNNGNVILFNQIRRQITGGVCHNLYIHRVGPFILVSK